MGLLCDCEIFANLRLPVTWGHLLVVQVTALSGLAVTCHTTIAGEISIYSIYTWRHHSRTSHTRRSSYVMCPKKKWRSGPSASLALALWVAVRPFSLLTYSTVGPFAVKK